MKVETGGMLIKFVNLIYKRHRNGMVCKEDDKPVFKFGRKHGRTFAVIVAIDKNKVGWSQCNDRDHIEYDESGEPIFFQKKDIFDKEKGIAIAKARAYECVIDDGQYGAGKHVVVPFDLKPHLIEMTERSRRYFK